MSHIPYYGEDDADKVVVKSNNRLVALASALLLTINPVSAQDVEKVIHKPHVEEITITSKQSKESDSHVKMFSVGLSNVVLVHIYDEKTDTWKYVGAENRSER